MKLISFKMKFFKINLVIEFRDSDIQNLFGINSKINIKEIQFVHNGEGVLGSKDENRFLIIFFQKTSLF